MRNIKIIAIVALLSINVAVGAVAWEMGKYLSHQRVEQTINSKEAL